MPRESFFQGVTAFSRLRVSFSGNAMHAAGYGLLALIDGR